MILQSRQSEQLPSFFHRWIVTTLAVLIADIFCPGIAINGPVGLLVAPLLLGILNALLKPLLMILSLPLLLFTLGFFLMVINAILLMLTSWLMGPAFVVDGFGWAFIGALIISVVTIIGNFLARFGGGRLRVQRKRRREEPQRLDDDDDGPVIDV